MKLLERPAARWAALLGGALAWRLFLFVGPQASDDLAYSRCAWSLAQGQVLLEGIHGFRLGYVGSIGLLYALFGAGPATLASLNLASSLAGIVLAWKIAREFLDEAGAWKAAALVAFLPADVFYASEAHPDMPLAALVALSMLLFLRAGASARPSLLLASGLALGAGHLFKETAFFGLIALAFVAGRPRARHLWVPAGFALVVALECLFFLGLTGDPLHRLRGTQSLQAQIMASDYYLQTAPTADRLFGQLPATLFWPGSIGFAFFALLPWTALGGAVLALTRKPAGFRAPILWAAVVCLLTNFWPISLAPYRPAMVLAPRILLPVAIPFAILAAFLLSRLPTLTRRLALAVILGTAGVSALILHSDASRHSEGARFAFTRLPPGLPVLSDPRTSACFRFYDGHRGTRPWLDWSAPLPSGPYIEVVNEQGIAMHQSWSGLSAPATFPSGGGRTLVEARFSGRLRLRSLVFGRIERLPAGSVTIRIHP